MQAHSYHPVINTINLDLDSLLLLVLCCLYCVCVNWSFVSCLLLADLQNLTTEFWRNKFKANLKFNKVHGAFE